MTNLVFLDTETTGLSDRAEIWEIGAILRRPDQADVEYSWQIRPNLIEAEPTGLRIGRYYERCKLIDEQPDEAFRLVHPDYDAVFGPDDIVRRTDAFMVAAELVRMLDNAILIGAVPWFDERKLQRFFAANNQCATNHYHLVDVETFAAGRLGARQPWNFDALLVEFGLKYDEADRHTALGDARMVRDLYDAVLAG